MNIDDIDMVNFVNEKSLSLRTNGFKRNGLPSLKNILLNKNECLYILDYAKNKIVYISGFQNVLEYPNNAINLNYLINNIHPDDIEIVNRLSEAVILYSIDNLDNVFNNVLYISYRRRKKDGSYIKVLSESFIYEINNKGALAKGLTKLTDITFMDNSNVVNWTFKADNLNKKAFKNLIYKAYNNFFTEREKEIIIEIAKDHSNKQISKKLYISHHTVSTHRKHIFKKSNTHNTKDLILFCKNRGVI